ncbi:MAG TPA: hypothetical protein V6C78_06145 [Crinalium sp.]
MAILKLEDGTTYTSVDDIARELAPLNVQLKCWSIGDDPDVQNLLAKDALSDEEKAQVLEAFDGYFEQLKQTDGYQSRDLIVLHPEVTNLSTLLAKFDTIHYHTDREVRYIITGDGVFGFVRPDGTQVELTVQAEDYINLPANIEHWFELTRSQRIKAVRYFTTTEGWVPEYTNTEKRFQSN